MQFELLPLNGLLLIKPDVFPDDRGYFYESFHKEKYFDGGLKQNFVQDNISRSKKGTVRGLHYQVGEYAQGKLCSVVLGNVLDVAVDIRFGSPTFGKYYSVLLSDENKYQFWIPPGFAHGFSVISSEAIFTYKCTNLFNKASERAIIYNDHELNINWQVERPVVSAKDINAKKFSEIEKDFTYSVNQ